jgi:hypothetical protein
MEPYAGIDYNFTLCRLQSLLQHMYHGLGNPIPESTLTLYQSRLYAKVMDLGFGLWLVMGDPRRGFSTNLYAEVLFYLEK